MDDPLVDVNPNTSTGNSNAPATANVSLADLDTFVGYLKRVCAPILDSSLENTTDIERLFTDRSSIDSIKKFISDPQCQTLLVSKTITVKEDPSSNETDPTTANSAGDVAAINSSSSPLPNGMYALSTEVHYINPKMLSLVVLKRGQLIESDKKFHTQLRIINLVDSSPYETLHAYISHVIGPYFKSYVRESGKNERDGDKMAPTMEKKITELEMGLLHLQQNIEIPEVNLAIHPIVSQVVQKCVAENRRPKVDDFSDYLDSTEFLNSLQSHVNRWVREIQRVTKLDQDPMKGSTRQEISFWLNLERALTRIQEKRESVEVQLTFDILRTVKRFHATVGFDNDTGLKSAMDTVKDHSVLMKDFPINDLLSANELDKIRTALTTVFQHLKKLRNTRYPVNRAGRLIEAVSQDLMQQMLKVLNTYRLMHIGYSEFERIVKACDDVFTTWDEEYERLSGQLRDVRRTVRSSDVRMAWRVSLSHKKLQQRLDHMKRFRKQHEQLRSVIDRVLLQPAPASLQAPASINDEQDKENNSTSTNGQTNENRPAITAANVLNDVNAIDEVNLAYESVKEVDGLDVSKEGQDAWELAMKRYDARIDRVEARITSLLRDQLGTAKNANEMFRIFSRFHELFVRPHIGGAIREYQTQLIQRVKDDIESLHEKFKQQYIHSKANRISRSNDLPPTSGSIIWAKQIEKQLNTYLRRVEHVLGKSWEQHVEGQRLKQDGDNFRSKLNTQPLFEDWTKNVQQKNHGLTGKIFATESTRTIHGLVTRLKVNFSPEIIMLSKEVRNIRALGFRVPLPIINKSHQANVLYPFAVSLIESVRTYDNAITKLADRPSSQLLVASLKRDIQSHINEGANYVWESYRLEPFVHKFSEAIYTFQERVDELIAVENSIDLELKSLDSCLYKQQTFQDVLGKIQKSVDDLSLRLYSNLAQWVQQLDEQIEKKLAIRLQTAIIMWTNALKQGHHEEQNFDEQHQKRRRSTFADEDDLPSTSKSNNDQTPTIRTLLHQIRTSNQLLYVAPPMNDAREQLILELYEYEGIITSQKRIQHSRYQLGIESESEYKTTFKSLLNKLPTNSKPLEDAYETIESLVTAADDYVNTWLDFQSLWDLQTDQLYARLGKDVSNWMSCLNEMKDARKTFDTQETLKHFGPITIDYNKVQTKVTMKYDSWHKEILSKFGTMLSQDMHEFHAHVSKARTDLESQSLEASTTAEAVGVITYVQALKRKMKNWEKQVDEYKDAQKILERQRYQFPSNWLYVDNIEGEWGAFNEILGRKNSSIQNQVVQLRNKITAEDKVVETRTNDLLTEWERDKPVAGHINPDEALAQLATYDTKLMKLKEERDNIIKAREALEITESSSATTQAAQNRVRVQVALEELLDLKGVWNELMLIWKQINELKEKQWITIQPRKLRQSLEELVQQLTNLPQRLRQYDSYQHVKNVLQQYIKVNILVTELKSEALKERHWKQLMRRMAVIWNLNDMTLGQVWSIDLQRHESIIREILTIAQGEKALEEFLKQVSEIWKTYQLELINYQQKCKVIKGWDDLFNKIKEHINSITAMKLSPYFKEFEEEANVWEDRLNRINALFDVWIDVQRRWVYLDGIFGSSADIKHLLPVETSRFQSVSTEFLALMKRVSKSPLVIDVLNIQGVQKTLERLAELLAKIQKALGEYLERERASFPRFYFVGDEDLLEIIGNSKNIGRLQKHFKKMFAGVHTLLMNEDNTIVNGVVSKEGEEVHFYTQISIMDSSINEWLTKVEKEISLTLAKLLSRAIPELIKIQENLQDTNAFVHWLDQYQAQLVVLAFQVSWSESIERTLEQKSKTNSSDLLPNALQRIESTLGILANMVLGDQPTVRRRKLEHLIIEHVHKRDCTRALIEKNIGDARNFEWLSQMRLYFDPSNTNVLEQLKIRMANAEFHYGFEYLGIQDRLVQTPLTDRCFLTMTQALNAKFGGSPFGPAGTGKTESVKALGHALGRFVLVFNCDESFDFQAMGRLFTGLCQVGAWGCFDEFNRLEERMLSAVSQQIQTIQEALRELTHSDNKTALKIELVGKSVSVNPNMAIFITMNPGYAGRSNLPDNLKMLFRSLAMTVPDKVLIAQVMLYSQGFRQAELLASKIVPLFTLCSEQLSQQSHYDFGLRALKNVLVMAGNLKRDRIKSDDQQQQQQQQQQNEGEQEIVIEAIMDSFVPRLVADDLVLLNSLLHDVFPRATYHRPEMTKLKEEIQKVSKEMYLICDDLWMEKVLQLYQIINLNHGLMLVGPSGCGKTTAWRVLLTVLNRLENSDGQAHVIDPKAISKDDLYGFLDQNTREWTDGLFTHIFRKIIDNVRGELTKRQWIIFDGDVDPEWVENLNSVLDDNKLLTLPNGERLNLTPNVRIMFEVQDLRYATLATVSRCGMIWFSEDVLSLPMIFENYFLRTQNVPVSDEDIETTFSSGLTSGSESITTANDSDRTLSTTVILQRLIVQILKPHFQHDTSLVIKALDFAMNQEHIMDFTRLRPLNSLFSMLNQGIRNILKYNQTHPDFPMSQQQIELYITRWLIYSLLWSFVGDCKSKIRHEFGEYIRAITTIQMPANQSIPLIDYEVTIDGEFSPWISKVPSIEIETHRVAATDLVIPTIDTIRHETLLNTWLAEHKPLVLCGPPGSGKTMTLFSALRALPDFEVVGLNFSSATTPELMLKTFDHYCEYRKTPNGLVLSPIQLNSWIIIFCDEINLPDEDKYGTQRIISFIRQILEHGGFYRTSDQQWVKLERLQFVGACNPPTDPGRKPLSHRFLRHVPVIYVDYPGETSLKQVYGTFNRAMLRIIPPLKPWADSLTNAMVEFYLLSQERFTVDMQPHYIYSPREMTRWVRGIFEAIRPLESLTVEGLVRLWAHEALRLFQDRLVGDDERRWTEEHIDSIARKHFPNIDHLSALQRPILFSNWLSKDYLPIEQEKLREYVRARLKIFYEEELDVQLVLFNEVLDHVLRIDRVFRQPQGHVLLIGVSGSGKTTLSRFVAWINGLHVFQIKVHNKYTSQDFDEDLRNVLRRSGCKGEKIAFILDESNMLDSSFLERMNTLLANGEVPGLFEGDEYSTLMTQCKEGAQRDGLMLNSPEELYKWFTNEVIKNLHVVFTMNPSSEGLKDRAATSPALFNRCVLNWMGDWSLQALHQVGKEFTNSIDLESASSPNSTPNDREAVIQSFVYVHQTLQQVNVKLQKKGSRTVFITPRHYIDFINHFVKLYHEKRAGLEEEQLHLNKGLDKIKETMKDVEDLQKSLAIKRNELEQKNVAANLKLKEMIKDQQEAEKQKITSQELQTRLQEQLKEIAINKQQVTSQLENVEPAVIEAQQAVKGIKRQHLVEIRNLPNPPPLVKLALEAICLLLDQETTDWKTIRGVIMKDDFINTIIQFRTEHVQEDIREKMRVRYVSNPDFTYEKVNRASQACGPMVKWARAQLDYADMLHQVEPLRNKLQQLEDDANVNRVKADELIKLIENLEKSITQYKVEYADLIAQAQAIKSDLTNVESKVERSVALLKSLFAEQQRWEVTSQSFLTQISTMVGDVLLCSAFMAYAGYYDQITRQQLFNTWNHHLEQKKINFHHQLARVEYLSNADERLRWQANSLPIDDLCTENAIMLKRFNRFPLIIDPSGQAAEFIMNAYQDKKITKTSFLDDSFRKNLESALRFGNPLVVQDVERYDPILNPVLNREVRRTGGRTLITIGDQDIDLSPAFTIFLFTRDPSVDFPPDICSRVTFVNFTVTRASLQSQCLSQVLKVERPDVDEKRRDLLKLQGEFQQRLRHLEKDLLESLNNVKGRILDDDTIITRLETLKREASDITKKVQETDQIMKEIENVSKQYYTLSVACSSIYFTMESLNQVHFLYQYSLQFFFEMFNAVFTNNNHLINKTDPLERLQIITHDLFQMIYTRIALGMLHEDRIVLALLLARIYLKSTNNEPNYDEEYDVLIHGSSSATVTTNKQDQTTMQGLTQQQTDSMIKLSKLPAFKNLQSQVLSNPDFPKWIEEINPELNVPHLWSELTPLTSIGKIFHQLLMIQVFRPDRFLSASRIFVSHVFGETFLSPADQVLDLGPIVEHEIVSNKPILMCSVPGYDASSRVEDLATQTNQTLISIAIGSAEGFNQAENAIASSARQGRWVLLKNVHLAPQWLITLEKRLHAMPAHNQFRLFLSMEIHPKLPSNLLRMGRIFVYEPAPGIKANLLRTFSTIPTLRMNKIPNERSRLYFLLAWFHAVIQERLRYVPLGWSKHYEFTEADLKCALDTIDIWIDLIAMGRTNLPIDKIPWEALRTLLSQCIYGGRIDNPYDQRLLNGFLSKLFSLTSLNTDMKLIVEEKDEKVQQPLVVTMPDGVKREQFMNWIEQTLRTLIQQPSWLGLPNNAEIVLLTTRARETLTKLLKMSSVLTNDEEDISENILVDQSAVETTNQGRTRSDAGDSRPMWMKQLHNSCVTWLKLLPPKVTTMKRTTENIKDPLFRFFEREVNTGSKLLFVVQSDLRDIIAVCETKKKQTNYHRQLISDLIKGVIPQSWKRYTVPKSLTVIQWITDFSDRVKQLESISKLVADQGFKSLKSCPIWLGGLFTPEAYVTASRQCVAQTNQWSLEELVLQVIVQDSTDQQQQNVQDDCTFAIRGLRLQGAKCRANKLHLSSTISTELSLTLFKWIRATEKKQQSNAMIPLPVYLNATRGELLFTIELESADNSLNEFDFYERGVAVLTSSIA